MKGEITAFLSLVFILLLSFIGALTESASIQVSKNYSRENMDNAIYSVFGEYQKNLLEEYEIFALEGTYETGSYSEQNLLDRLTYYGAVSMENEMEQIQLLSDENGTPLREQIIMYMKNYYGVAAVENFTGCRQTWEELEVQGEAFETERENSEGLLEGGAESAEEEAPGEDGEGDSTELISSTQEMTSSLGNLHSMGLLELVVPDTMQLSSKAVTLSNLPSGRSLHSGHGTFEMSTETNGLTAELYLTEYMMQKFGNVLEEKDGTALAYELEYAVGEKASDRENLEAVLRRLVILRMGTNFRYLQSDGGRRAEAEALGLTIATLLFSPEAADGITQVLLLAWAYGESIVDLRILLQNGRVPLVTSAESWQLPLYGLFTLTENRSAPEGVESSEGMNYGEYLRMLIYLKGKEQNTKAVMDLVEMNLQEQGLSFFRVDQCVTKMKVQSRAKAKRGFEYQFSTYFGYR